MKVLFTIDRVKRNQFSRLCFRQAIIMMYWAKSNSLLPQKFYLLCNFNYLERLFPEEIHFQFEEVTVRTEYTSSTAKARSLRL